MNPIETYLRTHDFNNIAIKVGNEDDYKNILCFLKRNGVKWGNGDTISDNEGFSRFSLSVNCIVVYQEGAYVSRYFNSYDNKFNCLDAFKFEVGIYDSNRNLDISDLID